MSERAHQRADVFETPSRLPHHWSRLGLLMLSCSILSVTGCRDFSEFDCFNQPNGCAEEVVTAPMIEGSMDSTLQGASDMMITQRPDRDRDVTRPRDAAVDRDEVDRGLDVRDEGMEASRDIDVVPSRDQLAARPHHREAKPIDF